MYSKFSICGFDGLLPCFACSKAGLASEGSLKSIEYSKVITPKQTSNNGLLFIA